MTKAQKIDALRNKGVTVESTASADTVNELYATHCIESEGSNQPTQVVADIADEIEKVVINGKNCEVYRPDSPKVKEVLDKKRANSFPNFIGQLLDGEYKTAGLCTIYSHQTADMERPSELILCGLYDAQNELHWVGSWDLAKRPFGVVLADGTKIDHNWVVGTDYSSNAERDRLACECPAGIAVVKKSGVGHWDSGKSPRNYFVSWLVKK